MRELKHLLCVDDEPDVLSIEQMCLETVGGYQVSTATNGIEALDKALSIQPDMILLDVMMPELDGPATLKRLKEKPETQNIPIVFMTARVRNTEIDEYLALGAHGVISKPFDPMTLSEKVAELWSNYCDE